MRTSEFSTMFNWEAKSVGPELTTWLEFTDVSIVDFAEAILTAAKRSIDQFLLVAQVSESRRLKNEIPNWEVTPSERGRVQKAAELTRSLSQNGYGIYIYI